MRSGMGTAKDSSLKSGAVFSSVVKAFMHMHIPLIGIWPYADFSTFAAKSSMPENIHKKNRTLLGTAREVRTKIRCDMQRSAWRDEKETIPPAAFPLHRSKYIINNAGFSRIC